MPLVLSAIVLILVIALVLLKKHNYLLILTILALCNDLFTINIGPSISVSQIVGLASLVFTIPFYFSGLFSLRGIFNILVTEYLYLIIIGLVFGFLIPWESYFDFTRSWTQQAQGRTIVSIIRLFSEICLMLYIVYALATNKVTLNWLVHVLAIIMSITVLIAIIDYGLGHRLKNSLFLFDRNLSNRFTAFNGEPRAFGRALVYSLAILIPTYKTKYSCSKHVVYLLIAALGVLLSRSVSSMVLLILMVLVYSFFNFKKTYKPISLAAIILVITLTSTNIIIDSSTINKFYKVLDGSTEYIPASDLIMNEPTFFRRLEVFDRAAANFLYHNPLYFFIGVGPNLISIPASQYITDYARAIYGETINSVPHMGILNILSRSGLIGVSFILLFALILMYKILLVEEYNIVYVLILSLIAYMLVQDIFFMFTTGAIMGLLQRKLHLFLVS